MRPLGLYSTDEDDEEIESELRRTRFDRLYPEPDPILPEPVQAPPPVQLPVVEPAPAPPLPVVDPRAERMAAFESKWGSPVQERAGRAATFESKWGPQSSSVLERYVTAPLTPEALDATVARVASAPAPGPRPAGLTGDIVPNQFDSGLSTEDAYAACGPVAAVAFARSTGRNPTVAEARNLAAEVGWTPQRGMAGPRSQKALLDKMGVPALLEEGQPDWGRVRADVESGNPVTISTPGHYFVAAGFDPETGRFDFGHSGTALRGGKRWMSPAELGQTGMGVPHATLYLDNPDTPQSSTAARGGAVAAAAGPIDKSSPAAFMASAKPYAEQVEAETGIPANIMLGIAVNEGAAAKGTVASDYNNVMGIKATKDWTGSVTPTMGAWEVINGRNVTQPSTFRAYDSPVESFRDFAAFLQENPRYRTALQHTGDPARFTQELKAAGYATDPDWPGKVLRIAGQAEATPSVPRRETYEDVVARNRPTRTVALRTAPEPAAAPPAPEPEPEPVRLTGDVDRGFTGIPEVNEPTPTNPFERVGRALVDALKGVPELAGQVPEPIREAAGAGVAALPGIGAFTRPEVQEAAGTALEAARAVTPTSIAARTVAGEEQIANESRAEYNGLLAAIERYGPESPEAEAAAETYNQAAARARAEGVYAAAERNPSLLPAELTAGLAGGLAAGVVAPSAAAGVARNVAASVLDPTQGLLNVVGPAARAIGRVGRAAEEIPVTVPRQAERAAAGVAEAVTPPPAPVRAVAEVAPEAVPPVREAEARPVSGYAASNRGITALYHETDPETALRMTRNYSTDLAGMYVSPDPTLALGQKGKGAVIEFGDMDRIELRPGLGRKPGAAFVRATAGQEPELTILGGGPQSTGPLIKSVTVKEGTTLTPLARRIAQRHDWPKVTNPDGSVTWTNPAYAARAAPPAEPPLPPVGFRIRERPNAPTDVLVRDRTVPLTAAEQSRALPAVREWVAAQGGTQSSTGTRAGIWGFIPRAAPEAAAPLSAAREVAEPVTRAVEERAAMYKFTHPWEFTSEELAEARTFMYGETGPSQSYVRAAAQERIARQAEAAMPETVVPPVRETRPARARPDPATMTGSAINRELDTLEKRGSAATNAVFALGRENEGLGTLLRRLGPDEPVARNYNDIADRTRVLRDEIAARYGPGAPSRLPTHGRGFGPRRRPLPAPEAAVPEPAAVEGEGVQRMYSGLPIPTPRFTRGPRAGMATEGLTPGEEAILYTAGQPTPRAPSEAFNPPRFARQKFVSADARLADAQRRVERDYRAAVPGATGLPEQSRAVELRKMESGSKHRANLRVQDLKDAYRVADQHVPELEKALEFSADLDAAAAVSRRSGQDVADARVFSGGRTAAESSEGLRLLERQLGPEGWATVQRAQTAVYQYVDGLRERLVQSGVWSKEFADQMRHEFPHYVPTRIWKYMEDPEFVPTGRKIGLNDNGIKKLTEAGTESERENVTDSLIRLAFESEQRAARNETARAVYGWRNISPELADVMRDVPASYKTTNQEEIHHLFDEGTKRTVAVDKPFAQALELGEPHKPLGLFSLPAAVTRTMAVERNPLFAIAGNPLLDVPSYLAHSSALYGPQKLPVFVYELMRAVPDVFAGIAENRFSGPGIQRLFGGGGGQLGYYSGAAKDVEKLAREVRTGGGFVMNSPKDAAEWLWDVTPLVGTRMENVSRVAAMRLAERAGADRLTVTMRGRAATMDFSEGGEWTKVMNSYVPFFNISTRPIPWLVNLAKQNPKGFAATMATGVIAPVALSEAWNRSDPERAAAYEQVPDYVKNQGMVVMAPEPTQGRDEQGREKLNYVLVPMRNFTSVLIPTRIAMERMMGDATPQDWQDAAKGIIGTSSPIQTDSATQALGNFVPNVVATALQLATDQDYFRGTRIASEYADERATALSKGIAGVTGARPSQVEFAARDVGAGVAGIVLAGIDMATKAVSGEPTAPLNPAIGERPFTGGLAGRFFRHQGGQVDRDLSAARDSMRDQLLAEVRADPRWATKSPQQQEGVERRIGEFATKVTYGTKTNPATILRNAQEYLRFKGATPQEMAEELGKLREALKEREEKATPRREAVRRELAGVR